ncbi:MAG: beta-galactosidase [Armatimonadetes bacterium]|nr:beta-galactosidase [Armatimonadota bacterium]
MTNTDIPLALPGIWHGGDYNPEQWDEAVWDDDARLMTGANWNVATLPVFGWASLEPEEGVYTWEWLDAVLEKLSARGIAFCLATATASVPAWLDAAYPDVRVTNESGVKVWHGNRHTFCPNSANFRRLSTNLARKIAERYGNHPGVKLWHISNEYGNLCYCDENCAPAFRLWLQERYGTLDELNHRWYTRFWGHTFTDWAQIEPPITIGERSMNALRLDYARFASESLLNCFRAEKAVLREITPDVPVTTNLMGAFFPLNYHEWAAAMDVVSWDNYPGPDAPYAAVAFNHALMRGLKEGLPFLLIEQSPSQQNWQPYNALKPPRQLRLQSFQAVAHGAESVMYFQWRRGRGGIEKNHGAVIEHHGRTDARVFREVSELGAELATLGAATLGGRTPARVAVLYDWETAWALRFASGPSRDFDYTREVRGAYIALHESGIAADVVSPGANLAPYDVIIAPTLTLLSRPNAARIVARVEAGATLLATAYTGLLDDTDLVYENGAPGALTEVLGLWVEESDALPPPKTNGIRFAEDFAGIAADTTFRADLLCDRVRLETARPIGVYTDDFYAGEPVFTVNAHGDGLGYYLASRLEPAGLQAVLRAVCREKGIASPLLDGDAPPPGVEIAERVSPDGTRLMYLLQHGADTADVLLTAGATYTDLLTGESMTSTARLAPRDVRVLRRAA